MAEMKSNIHYKILYSQVAQQSIHSVAESFKSFEELTQKFYTGELQSAPKLPKYRKKGGLAGITYPRQALKLDEVDRNNKRIRLPLGNEFKKEFGVDSLYIIMPNNLEFKDIRELRIIPRNRCFYAEFVYRVDNKKPKLDASRVLGIDPGLNNWLTCVSNIGTSFIIDGRQLKSMNQWFNKQVATITKNKPRGFWSKRLAAITEKRNRQVKDGINKAARLIINHCLEHQIGTLVLGWNQSNKQKIELGKKTNQEFVQIPTARLKKRLQQMCQQYGIQFVETEESYTSKASFIDNDKLPVFGDEISREGWTASGKRMKRGLYRTKNNLYINADCNGAANIIRKVSTTLGLGLEGVSRGSLTTPLRFFLWQTGRNVRRREFIPSSNIRARISRAFSRERVKVYSTSEKDCVAPAERKDKDRN
jgi:IS605 OrfB family transposase